MSRDNEVSQDAAYTHYAGAEPSRRRSVVSVSSAEAQRSLEDQSLLYVADLSTHQFPYVDIEAANLKADSFTDPREAQQWLQSFGELGPGTKVSLRLSISRERDYPSTDSHGAPPVSLLPTLSKWLRAWTARAEKARLSSSSSKIATAQSDLDWLWKYIIVYLGLEKVKFRSEEVIGLCVNLSEICLHKPKQTDWNHTMEILYSILRRQTLPADVLEQIMTVLCDCATIDSHDWPQKLVPCMEELAQSILRRDAIKTLMRFTSTPVAEDNMSDIKRAQGATYLIGAMLKTKDEVGGSLLDLTEVVDALDGGANSKSPGLCGAILDTYHQLLSVSTRKQQLITLDFRTIVTTLGTCAQVVLGTEGQQELLRSASASESSRQAGPRPGRERVDRINGDLEELWYSLPATQRQLVYDYFMYPQSQTSAQSTKLLTHARTQRLCWPRTAGWEKYSSDILMQFIQNSRIASYPRQQAITVYSEWCLDRLDNQISPSWTVSSPSPEVATDNVVNNLLHQTRLENNITVLKDLLGALAQLAFSPHQAPSRPLAGSILQTLQSIVTGTRSTSNAEETRHLSITHGIVSIFVHALENGGQLVQQAYDTLLEIASPLCQSRGSRIAVMRILYRFRADSEGCLYVQDLPECDYIAAALCRTQSSADAFDFESTSKRNSASSSSLSSMSTPQAPSWMHPEDDALPKKLSAGVIPGVLARGSRLSTVPGAIQLDMSSWLFQVIKCFQKDNDWETYSYALVHLGVQLGNVELFRGSLETIVKLRQVLCEQVVNISFREPPPSTGLKRSDVALCVYNILTNLIPYATMRSESIQKGFGDDLVRTFLVGIGGPWEGTARGCIHALSICSMEIPASVASLYPTIIDKLSKNMTQTYLTMHILEFLAQVASLPEVHSNFTRDEVTMIFGICIQFLEKTREQHFSPVTSPPPRSGTPARHSGINFKRPPYRANMITDVGLPQYASALAYHAMIFWFLSLKLEIRAQYVALIVPRLVWKNARGEETIDEQSQVFIDMMQRAAYSDLGGNVHPTDFFEAHDGKVKSKSWIVGLSVVTAETAGHTGKSLITKRQASGTTYASYQQLTTGLPPHHAPTRTEIRPEDDGTTKSTMMLPPHILLQLVTTAAQTNVSDQPVPLPEEDYVNRALNAFDRIPTVDSHKIGILYVGEGQTLEQEFLLNRMGSADYDEFLHGLGYKVSLEPPLRFNPQGLEFGRDGSYTIAWRDRITEIVYHIPTLMPTNLRDDALCIAKKAHVGNCHVNIIFNRSGKEWEFDNFKSQLNYVNIVITPASRASARETGIDRSKQQDQDEETKQMADHDGQGDRPVFEPKDYDSYSRPEFYKVHMITKNEMPDISPAAEPKVISALQLPKFVRVLALNANVFCQAWNVKDTDSEFPSSWRARLQQITTLRDRVVAKTAGQHGAATGTANSTPVMGPSSGRRTPIMREDTGTTQDGALAQQLDFSKFTL